MSLILCVLSRLNGACFLLSLILYFLLLIRKSTAVLSRCKNQLQEILCSSGSKARIICSMFPPYKDCYSYLTISMISLYWLPIMLVRFKMTRYHYQVLSFHSTTASTIIVWVILTSGRTDMWRWGHTAYLSHWDAALLCKALKYQLLCSLPSCHGFNSKARTSN